MLQGEGWLFAVRIILYLLGFLAIVLTLLPFLRLSAWWIRLGEFPRLQIAVVAVLVNVVFNIVGYPLKMVEVVFLTVLSACSVYQLFCILPYTLLYPKQVQKSRVPLPKKVIRILFSNVFIENRQYERVVRMVERMNADIVLLAETDEAWVKAVEPLKKLYPTMIAHPLDNGYGIVLFSRLKLINPELRFIIEDVVPSIHTDVELRSGDIIRLYCMHPRPPIPMETGRSTERDAELLIVGKEIAENDRLDKPTIIFGDLNDVAWSRTTRLFQKISRLLDPRVGRGMYSTFPVKYPLLHFPLDHIFHSQHFRLVELRRVKSVGSDHFPVFATLSLETTAKFTQEAPDADADDHAAAEETIRESLEILEREKRSEN
ncbi:MAG TPA: endonuclease/exonuclease/phosphatase family protein [Pyrinomonadaceae bacterium]|nr:endonuclease/exonuclease/phosphatase family protein [Pyrinomonadaceae bacterium]